MRGAETTATVRVEKDRSEALAIASFRAGDTSLLAQLYRERWGYLVRVARRAGAGADADDLVAEAFAKMLNAVRMGRGPSQSVVAYLTTTVRSLVFSRRGVLVAERHADDYELEVDRLPDLAERMVLQAALDELPARIQRVLRFVELEGHETPELALRLGISRQAAASLLYRAREALRVSYLAQHCPAGRGSAVHPSGTQLARHVRNGKTDNGSRRVSDHLAGCSACRDRRGAMSAINDELHARALAEVPELPESYALPAAGA